MVIDCVTLETNHLFHGNPIASQHKLRYRSVIERQDWEVPSVKRMEYDTYDNPAATYLIWRDEDYEARGVCRLYPTDRPYMLQEAFPFLVTTIDIPSDISVWEGSRFCVDRDLEPAVRKRIIQEIVVGYLEYGLAMNVEYFIGVMLPLVWRNIFISSGWPVDFIGEKTELPNGDRVRAGRVKVSVENLENVRKATGIQNNLLYWGDSNEQIIHQAAA